MRSLGSGRPPHLAVLVAVLTAGLTGCTAAPGTTGSGSSTVGATGEAACVAAVDRVVAAVEEQVRSYDLAPAPAATAATAPSANTPSTTTPLGAATPAPGSDATAPVAPTTTAADLADTLAAAREVIAANRCAQEFVSSGLTTKLAGIRTRGPIAAAVLSRLTASITGKVGPTPISREVAPGEDLVGVLAQVPAGSTVRLGVGEYHLSEPLVLLESVTIVGEGRDDSSIVSSAPDAAVLVLSPGRVELTGFSLVRAPGSAGSGIITGPAAALVLTGMRISGNRASATAQGGAAVHLSAQASDAVPRATTFEMTDSELVDNEWAGVAVSGAHQVSIESSSLVRNRECGICFLDRASGSVARSTFTDNGVGAAAVGTAHPVLIDDTFSGGEVGIQADEDAAPGLQGNTIRGVARAAVILTGRSGGTVEGTSCPSAPFGIVIGKQATPTLLRNACTAVGL